MRTMICPASNSNEFGDNAFFIFQFDKDTIDLIKARALLFLSLPFGDCPTYLTWLCESWGAWVDRKVVDRYLEDGKFSQDASEEIERMLGLNEAVLLPGEQDEFDPKTYIGGDDDDDDEIWVDCEQMIVTPKQVHFDCQFKNGTDGLSVLPMMIEDLCKEAEGVKA
jgi:hypothetical protein